MKSKGGLHSEMVWVLMNLCPGRYVVDTKYFVRNAVAKINKSKALEI